MSCGAGAVGRVQAGSAGTWERVAGSACGQHLWESGPGCVGVRSLILIYLEVATQGSLGEQGSCSEPKCVQTLNHVMSFKSPEVNPKQSHRGIVVLFRHLAREGAVLAGTPQPRGGSFCCRCPPALATAPCPPEEPHATPLPSAAHLLLDWRAWSQTETLMFPLIGISVLLHSLNWPLLLINEDPKVHVLKALLS